MSFHYDNCCNLSLSLSTLPPVGNLEILSYNHTKVPVKKIKNNKRDQREEMIDILTQIERMNENEYERDKDRRKMKMRR